MNYYKQFAEMLGLELEQEFNLTDVDGNIKGNIKGELTYKFTEDGLLYKSPTLVNWSKSSSGTILRLLNCDYKVVTKPWKPKYGEQYWSYSTKINGTCCNTFWELIEDYAMWKSGNCFRTEEEAATKGKEVMEAIHKEYEEA